MNGLTPEEKETERRQADLLIETYLDRICAKVKAKERHPELREEMRGHIDELIAGREDEGYSTQEAAAWALEQMGDANEVGSSLGQIHRPRFNWRLLVPIAVMAGLGVLALFSLSAAGEGAAAHLNFGVNQLFYYGLGILVLALCVFVDYRLLRKYAVPLYAVTAVLTVLFFASPFAITLNGAAGWILIGPFSFNWTLCMFILFLLALPGVFERLRLRQVRWYQLPQLLAIGSMLLPIALYVYFDLLAWLPLCAYAVAALTLYVRCGGSRFYLYAAPIGAIGWAGSLYLRNSYWRDRIGAVFAPQHQTPDNMYLNKNMAAAVREGGWFGQGFGTSGSSVVYPYNDAILPYLTYSFGWAAAALLVGSVIWLAVLLLRCAKLISDRNGNLLVTGLSIFLVAQWAYGIGASFGLLPFTTLGMPLIGYGGNSTLVYCAVIGIILGIYRRKDMFPSSNEMTETKPRSDKTLLFKMGRMEIYLSEKNEEKTYFTVPAGEAGKGEE